MKARRTYHGLSQTPEHRIWRKMIDRCGNPLNRDFRLYGARGILVCPRWMEFPNFYRDMGPRPSPQHSIDRYPDNDGPYSPENCRWALLEDQNTNKRSMVLVSYRGETKPLFQWAVEYGLRYGLLYTRIMVHGWDVERALTSPPCTNKANSNRITFRDETRHLAEWARRIGIAVSSLRDRLEAGWTVEKALTTPPRQQRNNRAT